MSAKDHAREAASTPAQPARAVPAHKTPRTIEELEASVRVPPEKQVLTHPVPGIAEDNSTLERQQRETRLAGGL